MKKNLKNLYKRWKEWEGRGGIWEVDVVKVYIDIKGLSLVIIGRRRCGSYRVPTDAV